MTNFVSSQHAIPQRVIDRIFDGYDVRGPEDCWTWQKSIGNHGYGQIGWNIDGTSMNAGTTAHRVAWIAVFGPIPDGLVVDHQCFNRACGNPAHLRLLQRAENAGLNAQKRRTHCPHGHPYSSENTYLNKRGHRKCRTCHLQYGAMVRKRVS